MSSSLRRFGYQGARRLLCAGVAGPGRSRLAAAQLGQGVSRRSQHAFPGHGQMKPEQEEIAQLKREVAKLKAERDILKNCHGLLSRTVVRLRAVETVRANLAPWRVAAVSYWSHSPR